MDKNSILHVINMAKDGTITSEEAAELIEALCMKKEGENSPSGREVGRKKGKLVIHVTPKNENGEAANITIPLGIADGFLKKFGASKGMDFELEEIEESGIHVETKDETVDIYVER